ncbi:Albicidin resistance protein [Caballeronia sordidicola]|uniref:Albicidin resistance protein n=1 Tax=Caballeronia sordidicola TaxID=196367 RepID=A0A226WRL8_CABSO|nr:Albicidin resistance protein [Caballeronia sordidicola]
MFLFACAHQGIVPNRPNSSTKYAHKWTAACRTKEKKRALSIRWMTLLERDTDGDPRLLVKLNLMHDSEPSMQAHIGIPTQLRDYVLRAFSESKLLIYEKYLSSEVIRFMRANYGKHAMDWPQLMADVRDTIDAIDAGIGPNTSQTGELARRWLDLFRSYASDDPRTQAKSLHALQAEPDLITGTCVDASLLAFVREATANAAQPL